MDKFAVAATLYCIQKGKWDEIAPLVEGREKLRELIESKGAFKDHYATEPMLAWVKTLNEDRYRVSLWWEKDQKKAKRYAKLYLEKVRRGRNKAIENMRGKPSLVERAKSLTKAGRDELAAARTEKGVTPELKASRLEVCAACPSRLEGRKRSMDQCVECGCYINRKAAWRTQRCPLGKWDKLRGAGDES
jgi:hypothetical protein